MTIRKLKFSCVITLASLVVYHPSQGQTEQLWLAAELSKPLENNFTLAATVSWRQSVPESLWKRSVVQFSGSYSHKSLRLLSGIANHYTIEEGEHDLFEVRGWQGVAATFPDWRRFELVHFLRMEQRFQKEQGNWSFSPRIRFEISGRVAINKPALEDRAFYLYSALEWLNNFGKPLRERFANTRASSVGVGFRFNDFSSAELIYEADVTENVRERLLDVDVSIVRIRWLGALKNR